MLYLHMIYKTGLNRTSLHLYISPIDMGDSYSVLLMRIIVESFKVKSYSHLRFKMISSQHLSMADLAIPHTL